MGEVFCFLAHLNHEHHESEEQGCRHHKVDRETDNILYDELDAFGAVVFEPLHVVLVSPPKFLKSLVQCQDENADSPENLMISFSHCIYLQSLATCHLIIYIIPYFRAKVKKTTLPAVCW